MAYPAGLVESHMTAEIAASADTYDLSFLERAKVSVIIPARDEEKNLPFVLKRIPKWVHEVVLVDGLSVDQTVELAKTCLPTIRICHQTGRGKGQALRQGFESATGDIIVMLDADGSMDPEEIPRFILPLLQNFDYAKGSRFITGGGSDDMTLSRKLGNRVLRNLVNWLYGTTYSDLCYGYCAFKRNFLGSLALSADGFEIETEMNVRAKLAKLRTIEVPSYEHQRLSGDSNLNAVRDGCRVMATILKHKLHSPELAKRPELSEDAVWEVSAGEKAAVDGGPRAHADQHAGWPESDVIPPEFLKS